MTNDGKQIGLGIQSFHDANKYLPTDIADAAGSPLLSWRVSICPYVDAAVVHGRFDLTQPWDSPANAPLIEQIPFIYRSILFPEAPGNTPWQGFVGPGTAFEPGKKLTLAKDFPDGTSYTIFVVEAQQQVPWSKPADIPGTPDIPLPPLGLRICAEGISHFAARSWANRSISSAWPTAPCACSQQTSPRHGCDRYRAQRRQTGRWLVAGYVKLPVAHSNTLGQLFRLSTTDEFG